MSRLGRSALTVLVASVFLLLGGCARKAPGPEECHEFALRWAREDALRLEPPGYRGRGGRGRLIVPQQEIAERARRCITTPFDRELVRCAQEGHSVHACLRAFEDRRRRTQRPNG